MDVSKEKIIVDEHQITIRVGNTGHTAKILIRRQGIGYFSAIMTRHVLPNGEECENVPSFPTINSDLELAVTNTVIGHFKTHHPQQKRPRLTVVKK